MVAFTALDSNRSNNWWHAGWCPDNSIIGQCPIFGHPRSVNIITEDSEYMEMEDNEADPDKQEDQQEAQRKTAQSAPEPEGPGQGTGGEAAGAGTTGPREGIGEGQGDTGGTQSGN